MAETITDVGKWLRFANPGELTISGPEYRLAITNQPVGWRGLDELATRLGIRGGNCGPGDISVQGRSGTYYNLMELIQALLDRLEKVEDA